MKLKTAIKLFRKSEIQVYNDLLDNERIIEFLKKACPNDDYDYGKNPDDSFNNGGCYFGIYKGIWYYGIIKLDNFKKCIPLSQIQPSKNKRISKLEEQQSLTTEKLNDLTEPKTNYIIDSLRYVTPKLNVECNPTRTVPLVFDMLKSDDEFVLPEKWKIKVSRNSDTTPEIVKWRNFNWVDDGYILYDKTWVETCFSFPEITFEQFKTHVLKEPVKEGNVLEFGIYESIDGSIVHHNGISKDGIVKDYGFNIASQFVNPCCWIQSQKHLDWKKSTFEEWESMLKKECEKRGIVKGARLITTKCNCHTQQSNHSYYNYEEDVLLIDGHFVYEKGKFATVLEHAKEEPFVLPDKWCVKRNPKNSRTINDWANKKHKSPKYFLDRDGFVTSDIIFSETNENYTEITFDQFKEHVLNKKEMEEEIDWSVPQLLISDNGLIVLSNGNTDTSAFQCQVIEIGKSPFERFQLICNMDKADFKPFKGKITIE